VHFLDRDLFSAPAGVDGHLRFSPEGSLRGCQLDIHLGKLYPLCGSALPENTTAHLSYFFSDHRYFAAHRIPHGLPDRKSQQTLAKHPAFSGYPAFLDQRSHPNLCLDADSAGHRAFQPPAAVYTEGAILLGIAYVYLPFMVLPLYASIEKLDPSLLEAAEDLGATPFWRFLKVTVPLTKSGILAGSLLVFIPSVGVFVVSDLLGGAKAMMIGNLVQLQFGQARNWPFGSAASFILMTIVLFAVFGYLKFTGGKEALEEVQ
jgi:ABC-type proline/glycine betaine transport system permease subunit